MANSPRPSLARRAAIQNPGDSMLRGWRWLWVIFAVLGLALVLRAGLVAFAGYVLLGVYLLSRYLAK